MAAVITEGKLKFFNTEKGFGFFDTSQGEVFVHITAVKDWEDDLLPGAVGEIEVFTEFKNGKKGETGVWKRSVSKIISLAPPPLPKQVESFDVWAMVKWYREDKGFGFVILHKPLMGMDAILHKSVCDDAGVFPNEGMPMKAVVTKTPKGYKVVSFKAGPEITDESMQASASPENQPESEVVVKTATRRSNGKKARKAATASAPAKKSAPKKTVRKSAAKAVTVPEPTDEEPQTAMAAAIAKAKKDSNGIVTTH